MIRFDGYYVTDAILYDDGRDADNKWYSYTGYLFLENGQFIRATKFSKDKDSIKFYNADFNPENKDNFDINEDKLIFYLNKGKSWESKECLKRLSSNQFRMKNGRVINFKLWENNEPVPISNDF